MNDLELLKELGLEPIECDIENLTHVRRKTERTKNAKPDWISRAKPHPNFDALKSVFNGVNTSSIDKSDKEAGDYVLIDGYLGYIESIGNGRLRTVFSNGLFVEYLPNSLRSAMYRNKWAKSKMLVSR